MVASSLARWTAGLMIVGTVLLALAVASSGAVAATTCKKAKGKFVLQPVSGPACESPVGICATGSYSGDIAGTNTFTGSSLVATVDTTTTGVVLLTGDNVIETAGGTLRTKDAIVLRTTGAGDFAEVDTIVAGTGAWAGVTGVIRAQGTFTLADGGAGEYIGEVCTN